MSEPKAIIYKSSETQYWYGEGGSLLCRYKPELWREGYSCETFGVSQHETELVKAIILATQRAERAKADREREAEHLRDMLRDHRLEFDDHTRGRIGALSQFMYDLRAERDALRKDAERLREAIDKFLSFQGSTREPEGQAALDFALAVQPTTGDIE